LTFVVFACSGKHSEFPSVSLAQVDARAEGAVKKLLIVKKKVLTILGVFFKKGVPT
jgi:hypothetical protein